MRERAAISYFFQLHPTHVFVVGEEKQFHVLETSVWQKKKNSRDNLFSPMADFRLIH
jgi:hypothetical protein